MHAPLFSRVLLASLVAAAVSAIGLSAPARAGEVVVPSAQVGAEGNWNNGFPFNIGYWQIPSMRYQQVYGAADWAAVSEPVLITEIRFRKDGGFTGGFSSVLPHVQINLSTTIFAPDQLTRIFDDNVGLDDTVVFDGPLPLSSPQSTRSPLPHPFDIVIPLQTPFLYDPSRGNLLLEVRNYGGGRTTFFDSHVASDQTSVSSTNVGGRVDSPTANFTYTGGLITKFAFVPARIAVALDVKPGDDSNLVRLKSNAGGGSKGKAKSGATPNVLTTAILTTEAFDAADVDVATLQLGDPALGGTAAPVSTSLGDADGDGDLDLFADYDLGVMLEAGAIDLDTVLLDVSAKARYGSQLDGSDIVKVKR